MKLDKYLKEGQDWKLTDDEIKQLEGLLIQFKKIAEKSNIKIKLIEDIHGTWYFHPTFDR